MELLRVPLDDRRAIDAASPLGAGVPMLDLGEADAPGDRAARRRAALEALVRRAGLRPAAVVGVAALRSGLVDADLDAVMAGAPGAVLLPGAVGGAALQHLAAKLAVREAEHGLPAGRTGIVAAPADTAAGVLALAGLAGASPRLRALVWDPGRLARSLGTGLDASPVRAARDLLLIAAAACGVPALDGTADPGGAGPRDGFGGRVAPAP